MVLLATVVLAVIALGVLVALGLTVAPAQVAYQNDSYQVPPPDQSPPPIPVPETYAQASEWVTKSALYAQAVPTPVRCTTPQLAVGSATDAQLKEHFESLMACIVRVWQPPLTKAGFQIVRPTVTIYHDKVTTKCGTMEVNALYCGADQQIYYSDRLTELVPAVAQNPWSADVVMAHEFGHALQGRTGILVAAHALGQQSEDRNTDLLYTRRLENQADCFSGEFMRSVSRSLGIRPADVDGIEATYVAVGDDTLSGNPTIVGNHGLARTRKYWGTLGLGSDRTATCNTFLVPAALVR